jgi:FKBP-type peptidyl-prolyl cis-trans isomerase
MKTETIIFIILGGLTLTGGGFWVGYYVGENQTKNSTVLEASTTNTQSQSDRSSGQQLRVVGAGSSDQDSANNLPLPSEFSTYEQYADEQAALSQEISEGSGVIAEPGDAVAVLYQGWLTTGELFDQTRVNESGQLDPFVFQLGAGQVITGWEQGIPGMREGGKRRLVLPASVAYGETGNDRIPPNSLLIFDVELVQVQKATQNPGL